MIIHPIVVEKIYTNPPQKKLNPVMLLEADPGDLQSPGTTTGCSSQNRRDQSEQLKLSGF